MKGNPSHEDALLRVLAIQKADVFRQIDECSKASPEGKSQQIDELRRLLVLYGFIRPVDKAEASVKPRKVKTSAARGFTWDELAADLARHGIALNGRK